MRLFNRIFSTGLKIFKKLNSFYRVTLKNDLRSTTEYKVAFFCGAKGMDFLNACLISIYKTWDTIPEIVIISDGTPTEEINKKLVKWPRKNEIIQWEVCANYFKDRGDADLFEYAKTELWGRKFVAIHYCALNYPTFYSDSDVLWFKQPTNINVKLKPYMKMSQDVDFFYTDSLVRELDEIKIYNSVPLNAGSMYLHGDFSSFPKWKEMFKFLAKNKKLGGFTEQTSNALLNNYFCFNNYFSSDEILIKIDDEFSRKFTLKNEPEIIARHYVSVKNTAFWRDFIYLTKFNKVSNQVKV